MISTKQPVACEICGKVTLQYKSNISRGRGRFCGKECFHVHLSRIKGGGIPYTCVNCGKTYYSHNERRQGLCTKCYVYREKAVAARIEVGCKVCGTPVKTYPCKVGGNHYCPDHKHGIGRHNKPTVERKCEICGVVLVMTEYRGQVHKRHYCSEHKGMSKLPHVQRACYTCGRIFSLIPSSVGKTVNCRECIDAKHKRAMQKKNQQARRKHGIGEKH